MTLPDAQGFTVLVVSNDPTSRALISRLSAQQGHSVVEMGPRLEELDRAAALAPSVAFVDMGFGADAGLAIVHHLQVLIQGIRVYVFAGPQELELATQAVALGASGLLLSPPSGDEILTVLSQERTRAAELNERDQLRREAATYNLATDMARVVLDLAESDSQRRAAHSLVAVYRQLGATAVIVYLAAGGGSRQLTRVAAYPIETDAPAYCEDMELLRFAETGSYLVSRLTARREYSGIVLLTLDPDSQSVAPGALLEMISAQAGMTLALLAEREQRQRGAMKDPASSAYTFSYFVDVAGREIDRARRHGRRFALAIISTEPDDPSVQASNASSSVVDRILMAVRDTDILAAVEDGEYHLLLPETGGIGAHTCRRRILEHLAPGGSGVKARVGVATYPHDGSDLSQLLRVARHRSEVSSPPLPPRLATPDQTLRSWLDGALSQREGELGEGGGLWRAIELSPLQLSELASSVVEHAARGGKARAVATRRQGLSIGAAVKAALGGERDGFEVKLVDISSQPGVEDLEALTIVAEHGCYVLVGRHQGDLIRAVHSADPALVDWAAERLGEVTDERLVV